MMSGGGAALESVVPNSLGGATGAKDLHHQRGHSFIIHKNTEGSWVAQLLKRGTSAQAMVSRSVSSRPASRSALTAQTPKPASDSVSPSLSVPPPLMLCLSVS